MTLKLSFFLPCWFFSGTRTGSASSWQVCFLQPKSSLASSKSRTWPAADLVFSCAGKNKLVDMTCWSGDFRLSLVEHSLIGQLIMVIGQGLVTKTWERGYTATVMLQLCTPVSQVCASQSQCSNPIPKVYPIYLWLFMVYLWFMVWFLWYIYYLWFMVYVWFMVYQAWVESQASQEKLLSLLSKLRLKHTIHSGMRAQDSEDTKSMF